jgi:hypothetical protein
VTSPKMSTGVFARRAVRIITLATALIGMGSLVVNMLILIAENRVHRVHKEDSLLQAVAGTAPLAVPWWFYLGLALACATVVIVCWDPKRWPIVTVRPKIGFLSSAPLPVAVGILSVVVSVTSTAAGDFYTPLGAFSLYGIATAAAAINGFVCLVWWRRESLSRPHSVQRQKSGRASDSLLKSFIVAAVFVSVSTAGALATLVPFVGAAILEARGETPVVASVYDSTSTVYTGHLPFTAPGWAFAVIVAVLVVIAVVTWPTSTWPARWSANPAPGELPMPGVILAAALGVLACILAVVPFSASTEEAHAFAPIALASLVLGIVFLVRVILALRRLANPRKARR